MKGFEPLLISSLARFVWTSGWKPIRDGQDSYSYVNLCISPGLYCWHCIGGILKGVTIVQRRAWQHVIIFSTWRTPIIELQDICKAEWLMKALLLDTTQVTQHLLLKPLSNRTLNFSNKPGCYWTTFSLKSHCHRHCQFNDTFCPLPGSEK